MDIFWECAGEGAPSGALVLGALPDASLHFVRWQWNEWGERCICDESFRDGVDRFDDIELALIFFKSHGRADLGRLAYDYWQRMPHDTGSSPDVRSASRSLRIARFLTFVGDVSPTAGGQWWKGVLSHSDSHSLATAAGRNATTGMGGGRWLPVRGPFFAVWDNDEARWTVAWGPDGWMDVQALRPPWAEGRPSNA